MSTPRHTWFLVLLAALTSAAAALVISSRLGLSPESSAQTVTSALPPMNSAPINGPLTSSTFRDVAKSVTPAVVNIRTESRQRTQDLSQFFGNDLFERFFGQPGQPGQSGQPGREEAPRERLVQAAGTGFIIDKRGFILTNNHVVEGATVIKVSLYGEDDDQEYEARVVGRDPLTDSALIELTEKPAHELPEIAFGDSAQMQPGDWVMAIGNPFGLAHTVSVGVISGLERPFEVAEGRWVQVLQTDAAINPGNSGGPLLNLRGEVIGINTAIYTDARQQGNIGIGFAVPSNLVRELLPQLRIGKITRGRIGVGIDPVPREAIDEFGLANTNGALVRSVTPGGAASRAGLEPGDVVIAFNGQPVVNNNDLVQMVVGTRPGTTVPLRIVRNREERTLNITVEELDLAAESTLAQAGGGSAGPPQATSTGFGLTVQSVTPEIAQSLRLDDRRGAVITDIDENSPAARAGLQAGDVILRAGSVAITSAADAQRELGRVPSGGTALLRIFRGGQETFITVTRE